MAHEDLIPAWREAYNQFCASEYADEADFESFCLGWCAAKGLTPDEGNAFYQAMVPLGLF